MASGKNDARAAILNVFRLSLGNGSLRPYAHAAPAFGDEPRHLRQEMHIATARYDLLAHTLYDAGQAVGAYVWMGIHEDVG